MYQIEHYLSQTGRDFFNEWVSSLPDRRARAFTLARVGRMEAGAFGDCKPVGDGVWEARIDYGPGYRVYYARAGSRLILLLTGGDKRRQKADIARAIEYWNDWQERKDK
jgi:putative addiction module killer protein